MAEAIKRISVRVEVETHQSTHVLDVNEADGFDHVQQLVDEFLGGLVDYLTYADRIAVEADSEEEPEAAAPEETDPEAVEPDDTDPEADDAA